MRTIATTRTEPPRLDAATLWRAIESAADLADRVDHAVAAVVREGRRRRAGTGRSRPRARASRARAPVRVHDRRALAPSVAKALEELPNPWLAKPFEIKDVLELIPASASAG
jgi:hypothetical protein